MFDFLKSFFYTYANSRNLLALTACTMLILAIIKLVLFLCGDSQLKKLVKILADNYGDDIIRTIEEARLFGRYEQMWNDYYSAFCHEDTVSLNNYLLKKDTFIFNKIFLHASRLTALLGFCIAAVAAVAIPYIFPAEKNMLICTFFILLGLECVLEIFYNIIYSVEAKRHTALIEKFDILALRKLPGKAVGFSEKYVFEKLNAVLDENDSMRIALNQLNARLDRQYKWLCEHNDSKNNEENGKEQL